MCLLEGRISDMWAKWCGESAIYFKKMKFDVKWLLVPNGDIHIKME